LISLFFFIIIFLILFFSFTIFSEHLRIIILLKENMLRSSSKPQNRDC